MRSRASPQKITQRETANVWTARVAKPKKTLYKSGGARKLNLKLAARGPGRRVPGEMHPALRGYNSLWGDTARVF